MFCSFLSSCSRLPPSMVHYVFVKLQHILTLCFNWVCFCTLMSLLRYRQTFPFCFLFLARAPTLCGKISVPRPQSCTLNSGERYFLWTVNLRAENSYAMFTDSLCNQSTVNTCCCVYRTTILAAGAFLDAFQKVADMATNSRGK